jgi:hypothetical protein
MKYTPYRFSFKLIAVYGPISFRKSLIRSLIVGLTLLMRATILFGTLSSTLSGKFAPFGASIG